MAVSKSDLLIKIQADTSQAVVKISEIEKRLGSIEVAGKKSSEAFSGLAGSMGKLGAVSIALNQGLDLAYKVFSDFLKPVADSVVAFQKSEDNVRRLSQTLSMMGEKNIPDTVSSFRRLAQGIQETTGVSDDVVLSLATMAKTSGLTTSEVERLATAAADFSAGAGISFEQAFSALQKSLKGSAMGVATFRPELSNLTQEQLKAGEAIRYVSEVYRGFASVGASTFTMSLLRSKNAAEDLTKAFGGLVSDFIPVQKIVETATSTIRDFTALLKMIPKDLGAVSLAYQAVRAAVSGLADSFDMVFETISRSILLFVNVAMTAVQGLVTGILSTFTGLAGELSSVGLIPESLVEKAKKLTDRFSENTKSSFDAVVRSAKAVGQAVTSLPGAAAAQSQTKGASPLAGPGKPKAPVDMAQLKELDSLRAKTIELQTAVNAFNLTQREQIRLKLEGELQILEVQRKQFEMEGKKKAAQEIQKQMDAKKALAGKQIEEAPASAYEGMVNAGKKTADMISGRMSEGLAGSIAGAAAAANTVLDAVQGLLDLGPSLLSKIANIFSSLAELPDKLLEGVMNIDQALGKFIDHFPEAMVKLFSKLPELVGSILYKLGEFLPKITEGLIRAVPAFVIAMVKQAPRIAIALVKGFISGLRDLIGGLFDGSMFKMPKLLDAKQGSAEIKKISKQLTSEASRVFSVLDFSEGAKRADSIVSQVTEAGKEATKAAADYWKNTVQFFQQFFQNLGSFLEGIGPAFKAAWIGFKNAIGPFFQGIFDVFRSIFNTLFDSKKWSAAFSAVVSAFENTIGTLATNIWRGLVAGIEGGAKIFSNIGKAIGDAIGTAITSAVDFVMSPIKKIFNVFIGIINGLKLPEIKWKIDAGALGKASGTLIPGVDLIPGEIQKFAKGGMVSGGGNLDTVPALLTPGEFVVSRNGVRAVGLSALEAINSGRPEGQNVTVNQAFDLTINASEKIDENFIRSRLVPAIKKELKRASLDGQFVLAQSGVR